MAAPPRPPPALMDDVVDEILLHLPPDEPAHLARAALVCKRWCRLVTDPGFPRRLRQLHCTPPLLGYILPLARQHPPPAPRATGFLFLPTSSFRPPDAVCRDWCPLDARHGRILFYHDPICTNPVMKRQLIVWTSAAGEVRRLPMLQFLSTYSARWNAVVLVLCVTPGCDHMECSSSSAVGHGHFTVVLVGRELLGRFIHVYVYSSEADEWSQTASIQEHGCVKKRCACNALVGNALYFLLENNQGIMKYDLAKKELSVIRLPPICNCDTVILLMSVDEDGGGGLGFAMVQDFSLCIWLRESAPTPSGWTWTQHRSIDLRGFPHVSALSSSPNIVALADSVGDIVILAGFAAGFLAIDLKSGRVRKVFDGHIAIVDIIPYISFCTPALRATCIVEGPSMGGSNNA